MLKDDQLSIVAGRTIKEILERFDKKIKDSRRASKGRNISKIIKEFLRNEWLGWLLEQLVDAAMNSLDD